MLFESPIRSGMLYSEYVAEYEALIEALITDESPRVEGFIYSKASWAIANRLSDLIELYPEFEEAYDESV